jgi:hypothetical protein
MIRLNTINVSKLIKAIKNYGVDKEGLDLTVGFNPKSKEWDYQTGDNSYSGSAYHYPVWGVTTIFPRSKSKDLAKEVVNQISEQSDHFCLYHEGVA